MPDANEAVARAIAGTAPGAMTDESVVRQMWQAFKPFPPPSPGHPVETTSQTPERTAAEVQAGIDAGRFVLSRTPSASR